MHVLKWCSAGIRGFVVSWVLTCFEHKISGRYLKGWDKKWHTNCMHNNVYAQIHEHTRAGRKDTHKRANTHNRKSVNEWEGAGRPAGAVLVEDMAFVHLSISKHSQLSSLSTGREVTPFFFSPLHHRPLSSPHFCFPLLLQPLLLSHLSTPHRSCLFHILPPQLLSFFPQHSPAFPFSTPPFSSPCPPSSSAPRRLLRSQWNSPFSNKTKLPTASHTG